MSDVVNPSHYRKHPSGVECITITEHFNFNLGNAIKYIWRADDKDDSIENLEKAKWYIEREIQRRFPLKEKEEPLSIISFDNKAEFDAYINALPKKESQND